MTPYALTLLLFGLFAGAGLATLVTAPSQIIGDRLLEAAEGIKAERDELRAKVAESEAHLRRYMTYAEHLDAKPEIYDAAIAKRTAYEIRDRMVRKLDREFDEAALELIEDIATEHAMAERAVQESKRAKPVDGYQPRAEAQAPANPPAAR